MTVDIILTTEENKQIVEKKVGTTRVSQRTDIKVLLDKLAAKRFGEKRNVRRDSTLFGFVAVSADGDTLHLV